ncbi:uncharacterized protein LOC124152569 isoform X1 [Haliotis rufescens]|uniref:uncharacterized protein LOC124152569 isoform X1 n=2 Tax=Haliotis rufescens TaxID=6454 RepID=UPI00201E91D9|nr:uncharacterized protein LOC124152569 isoform X1 [Haliotis rufescens]XP_048250477.1 uncharacterized protein LOC124152569 isoform X1 [Haliotis rufescens]
MTSNSINMIQSDTSYHYIYIWMPLGFRQFGHASLYLSNRQYVSLWPQEVNCRLKKKQNLFKSNLHGDINEEGTDPDYTYRISATELDLAKMMTFLKNQKTIPPYSLLLHNCCSAVYQILHAGGAPKSLTIIWRPETLRRYFEIYLGGGSNFTTLFNLPGWDSPFKEKITLHTWKARDGTAQHFALSLDYSVYVSWWPRTSQAAGYAASSLEEDRTKMGRVEDGTYILPGNQLEYHLMRRRWKKMLKEETSAMGRTTSDWVIHNILIAGGISVFQLQEIMSANGMFETLSRE